VAANYSIAGNTVRRYTLSRLCWTDMAEREDAGILAKLFIHLPWSTTRMKPIVISWPFGPDREIVSSSSRHYRSRCVCARAKAIACPQPENCGSPSHDRSDLADRTGGSSSKSMTCRLEEVQCPFKTGVSRR
jgi:hypothetical protein